jgi:ankyrin repeat protein
MAMNELQSNLLRLLSKGKNKQDFIIEQIDKLILDSGLKQITKWRNSSNEKKNPLLHELVERELINVVSHVVEKYAFDVNLKRETDGITAFQVAFEKGDSKMCDLLKKIGATEILVEDVSSWEKDKEKEKEQLMNIVWLDLEMTCFENPEILECAVIITDKDLNPLAQRKLSPVFIFEFLTQG